MSRTDLDKASHVRFSRRYYDANHAFRRMTHQKLAEKEKAIYLEMANNATIEGDHHHAEALRQVAVGFLPREWAKLH